MEIVNEDIIEFLKNITPFQDLSDTALSNVVRNISTESYPKGAVILRQDGPASECLRIIKKGAVKVFIKSDEGEEVALDYRGMGDSFGFLSLVSSDKSRANIVAIEDTTCYVIGKEIVLNLLETTPAFTEYFCVSFLNKHLDKTYHEMRSKSLNYSSGDRLLFTTPVGELATKEVITALEDITIKEAAVQMSKNRISSLILVDRDGIPAGIVTDRDLRDKVTAKGRDVSGPVRDIMSVSLIKSEARDYCFEALLKMIRCNVHHLLIIDNGMLKGVVTNHDLMMLQGTSPLSIAQEIESQQSIEGLVPASQKTNRIVELLLKEGAKATNITRVISEINDRLARKVLEITEKKCGPPPLPYCWISFGSEGRKEQTFRTDQDNAIIYEDPKTKEEEAAAEQYFSAFTEEAKTALFMCGFPLCPGNYMASNPLWRRPLADWKKHFSGWISSPTPKALLNSLIFFDFRPVFGDYRFAENLRSHLNSLLTGQNVFLALMARETVRSRPPLGFFKNFIVEKSGEHKDELDLKFRGIGPVVNIARLFALEKGIAATATADRLAALKNSHAIVRETGEELMQAFEFMMLLRIHHQAEQKAKNVQPDNFINPGRLSGFEKKALKDAFKTVARIQDAIADQYGPGMVGG